MLAKSRAEKRHAKEAKITEGGEAFMPDDKSVADTISTWGVVNVDSTESGDPTEELRVPSSKLPWAISKSGYCPLQASRRFVHLSTLRQHSRAAV